MTSAELVVAHGNGHNEVSLVVWLGTTFWHAASVCEVDRLTRSLHRMHGSRLRTSAEGYDRARDTGVLVKDRFHSLGGSTTKVSAALGKPGSALRRVAPPRTLVEERFEHPLATELGLKGVALFSFHPDAGPRQLDASVSRVRALGRRLRHALPILQEYRRSWARFRQAWRTAAREGFLCVATGDLQMTSKSRRPWAPRAQIKRLGASWWSTGLDWLIIDPRAELVGHPRTHDLYDHTGFTARLRARSSR